MFTSQLKVQYIITKASWWEESEVTGHRSLPHSRSREGRTMILDCVFLFTESVVPNQEVCLPHSEWVFLVLKMPNGYTQKCEAMVILNPVKLILKTNSHRLAKLFEKKYWSHIK